MNGSNYWLSMSGLFGLDIDYILIFLCAFLLILLIAVIVLTVNVNKLKKRLTSFTLGSEGNSLEQDIITIIEDNKFLRASVENNKKLIRDLSKKQESCFQKMGIVKYDAFHQMGGQLSFSLCLLDENNNGFIINSVHSTEGSYCYTKEIKNGESALDLGDEEAEALDIALSQ